MTNLRDELAKLNEQTIVLPNDATVEILEPSQEAFVAYQEALRLANERIKAETIRRGDMPIVEPIDRDKAWGELVIDDNMRPPRDTPIVSDELRASTLELQRFIAYGKDGDES